MRNLTCIVVALGFLAAAFLIRWQRSTNHQAQAEPAGESALEASPPDDDPPEPAERADGVVTRVIAVADGIRTSTRKPIAPSRLVGHFYLGDGLGVNWALELRKDESFEIIWTGCLGEYGRASGTWALDDAGVAITTTRATGMFQDKPVGRLFIATFAEHTLLVPESDRDVFNSVGPDGVICFHRRAARFSLHGAWADYRPNKRPSVQPPAESGPQPRVIPDSCR